LAPDQTPDVTRTEGMNMHDSIILGICLDKTRPARSGTYRLVESSITNAQIEALRVTACAAGDVTTVQLCREALEGDASARCKCSEIRRG
jgi:hypothetical protein